MHTVDEEMVNHITAMRYPNSHSHLGGSIVTEKFRGNGYYTLDLQNAIECCDPRYTIGGDNACSLSGSYT